MQPTRKDKLSILFNVVQYQSTLKKIDHLEQRVKERKIAFWLFALSGLVWYFSSGSDEGSLAGIFMMFVAAGYRLNNLDDLKELDMERWSLRVISDKLAVLGVAFTNAEFQPGVYLCSGEVEQRLIEKDPERYENHCAGDAERIQIWDEKFFE